MNYTYIVRCRDHTLYTGWTNDLTNRVKAHNKGTGSRYTRSRRPVTLVYYEEYETKQEAMKREYEIKQMAREEKLALIRRKNTCESLQGILPEKKDLHETCRGFPTLEKHT